MKKLTKRQQIFNLKKLLGSSADLIDLDARVDGRLTYEENKREILKRARRVIKTNCKLSFKGDPLFYLDKAEKIHAKRSIRSKALDSRYIAKKTFNPKRLTKLQFLKWKRNPQRYDIFSVDSRNTYQKKLIIPKKKLSVKDITKIDADIL